MPDYRAIGYSPKEAEVLAAQYEAALKSKKPLSTNAIRIRFINLRILELRKAGEGTDEIERLLKLKYRLYREDRNALKKWLPEPVGRPRKLGNGASHSE